MSFALEEATIFVTLAGSQAHGTAREGSDLDLRGACVAPLRTRVSLFTPFEQYEGPLTPDLLALVSASLAAHPTASRAVVPKSEVVIFDVAKLLALLATANPNALELLFADERDWLFVSPTFRILHAERHRFLTKKVQHTFVGYALAQLRRIRTHRAWLIDPPRKKPVRTDFGLSESESHLSRDDQNRIERSIAETMRSYAIDELELPSEVRATVDERFARFVHDSLTTSTDPDRDAVRDVATSALALPRDVVATLEAERRYRGALKHWDAYQTWQRTRNPARAELERRHGYDTKHAMHLVRLMRMGLDALRTGELPVRREDAAELQAIRDGALSFDELVVSTTELENAMKRASASSTLPDDVDRSWVDELLWRIVDVR